MITALALLITPAKRWQRIAQADRGIVFVLFVSLLPLMLLAGLIEGYGLIKWGEKRGDFGAVVYISQELAIRHEAVQIGLGLLLIFVGSKFIQWIGAGFNFEPSYNQCFTLVAYGSTPIYLARFLYSVPLISTWFCWTLGALGFASVLYQGIAYVLKPSPTKGFGLYLLSVMILIPLSGIGHLTALSLLHGKLAL